MNPEELPFDSVTVQLAGGRKVLTVDDFVSMPLEERIQHMLSGDLRFLRQGEEIDRREALRALRNRAVAR